MSLIGHLRVNVGDIDSSGSTSFTLDTVAIGSDLIGQLRVDVADVPISGEPLVEPIQDVTGGPLVRHFRVDVADVVSQTGIADSATLPAASGGAPLLNHLRVDINDVIDTIPTEDGCLIVDCADISNNLSVGGNINIGGDVTIDGNLIINGSQCLNTTLVTSSYVANNTDTMILANNGTAAPITIVLPNSPCSGRVIYIKDIGGNANSFNITVVAATGTIDGLAGFIISQNYQAITLLFNGVEWSLI